MRKLIVVLALLTLGTGCRAVDSLSSTITGRPTEHRMTNGDTCYVSTQGSISCTVGR